MAVELCPAKLPQLVTVAGENRALVRSKQRERDMGGRVRGGLDGIERQKSHPYIGRTDQNKNTHGGRGGGGVWEEN